MRQIGYAAAFALVLVAIVVGTFFGGRFVLQRFRQDFQFRRDWSPPKLSTSATPEPTLPGEAAVATLRPVPTEVVVPTPIVPTPAQDVATNPVVPTAEITNPTDAPAPSPATPVVLTDEEAEAPTPSEEATPSLPTPVPSEPFGPRNAVRTSLGDCGGILVLGMVSDTRGAPLPRVRLRLVDEFGNEALAVTKSEQADMGRYDFPVSGPPRRFSLSVVDEAGSALSRPVSFDFYGNAPDAQATCYWVDWQRR